MIQLECIQEAPDGRDGAVDDTLEAVMPPFRQVGGSRKSVDVPSQVYSMFSVMAAVSGGRRGLRCLHAMSTSSGGTMGGGGDSSAAKSSKYCILGTSVTCSELYQGYRRISRKQVRGSGSVCGGVCGGRRRLWQ